MSNTERQRKFRERNPGYYARIQARKRESAKRGAVLGQVKLCQMLVADPDPLKQEAAELIRRSLPAWALQPAEPVPTKLLMLPAPSQEARIPGVNAIPTRAEFEAMQVTVEVPQD